MPLLIHQPSIYTSFWSLIYYISYKTLAFGSFCCPRPIFIGTYPSLEQSCNRYLNCAAIITEIARPPSPESARTPCVSYLIGQTPPSQPSLPISYSVSSFSYLEIRDGTKGLMAATLVLNSSSEISSKGSSS